jgi:hypothetical protein
MPVDCNQIFELMWTQVHMMIQFSPGSAGHTYWYSMFHRHDSIYSKNC